MLNKKISTTQSDAQEVIKEAVAVLKLEAEAVLMVADRLDENFADMVDTIYNATGRVIIGGIGKSGLVGRKIVATLNSTGTRALFIHPVEAMHGDLGIVCADDVFMALSNSGDTEELNVLLPSIRNIGCSIIAMTGNIHSTLAKQSDIVIDVGVEREACPLGLAPTASTTALLAMGDALAAVLINRRDFNSSDFRKFHPGGTLGQRLCSRVSDIMLTGDQVPFVYEKAGLENAVREIDRLSFGAAFVLDEADVLVGIITDGDLRRMIAGKQSIEALSISEVMTPHPRRVGPLTPAYDALNLMERYQITVLPIADGKGRVLGLLHLHDILGKGEFRFNGT